MASIICDVIDKDTVRCNGTDYIAEQILTYHDEWFWIYLGIYVGLVLMAGLMSGLTMGLLSLDLMSLKVMKDGGTPTERKHAKKILPVVSRHHLLLVTLLLANAAAVESMPIFLDKISDPIIAVVVSVTAVLIFGEVIPQAICTRFGLAIGAALAPLVYFLMAIFYVIAWPMSKILDCVLGKDHTTFYRRAQLKVLVNLHGPNGSAVQPEDSSEEHQGEHLSIDEVLIIQGALDMKTKTVKVAMLPLDDVFMLSITDKMDKATMMIVMEKAHSRVPIYDGPYTNIVGVLLVKSLIFLDPEDATPISSLLHTQAGRNVMFVDEDMPLFDLLNIFQTGKSHIAFVQKNSSVERYEDHTDDVQLLVTTAEDDLISGRTQSSGPVIGIITLEDVIEELIQEEIIDETDVYVDIHKRIQVARAQKARRDQRILLSRQVSKENQGAASEGVDPQELMESLDLVSFKEKLVSLILFLFFPFLLMGMYSIQNCFYCI
ncbi:DUF21 domain-containing protein At1g47330-like [Mizuhopecten yessoensis]|uniref:DUF21 domain-containing protein At1g47330-like n=1 Tax=Mizuhopecten yessoensis TaxID=6573 RepID=UPI000B458377|nr:DUF21 domain-containing protein At1g47330-like [Mizuhopecten yessoensis]